MLTSTNAAFESLAERNPAVSMSVIRDGAPVLQRASGTTVDGASASSDSPMVVASVSKLLTALEISRLEQAALTDVDGPIPWSVIGISPHPAWLDVTVRELLAHTSGMPVVRTSWFDGGDDCRSFLPSLVATPPQPYRGRWMYSNGNYCTLGLLVESTTGVPLGAAAQGLLLDPIGLSGVHLTTDGPLPGDVAHGPGLGRLSRLGGAGAYVVSTDDLALTLAAMTDDDRATLRWPGVLVDQYGWGHTGTVSGAKACAWILDDGRTVVSVTVAGNSPSTGGAVCDLVVPALGADLGNPAGRPVRTPP